MKIFLTFLICFSLLIGGAAVLAQEEPTGVQFDPGQTFDDDPVLAEETQLGTADPIDVVGRIINIGLGVLGLFFLLLMIYGGYIWMNARGNEEEVTKAKKIIMGAVIGLVIILASYGVSNFVFTNIYSTTDPEALTS